MRRCSQSGHSVLELAVVLSMVLAGLIAIVDLMHFISTYRALNEVANLTARQLVTTQGAGVKVSGSAAKSSHVWYYGKVGSNAVPAGPTRPAVCNQNDYVCEIRYPPSGASSAPITISQDTQRVATEFANRELKAYIDAARVDCEIESDLNCFKLSVDQVDPAGNTSNPREVIVTASYNLPLALLKIFGQDSATISASARDRYETTFQNREVLVNNERRSTTENGENDPGDPETESGDREAENDATNADDLVTD